MKGHEIISHIVRKEMPDRERVREDCHRMAKQRIHDKSQLNSMHTKRAIPLVAALVVILAMSTTVFAFGGFDWFIHQFNPSFADVVEAIMEYSEEQGIRMTVIGAQKYGNMAIVYLSVQDTTGENRLTESLSFWDGFGVGMEEKISKEESASISGFSSGWELLYFDEASNTAFLEIEITGMTAISDPLRLSTFIIVFEEERFEYERIPLSLADIPTAETLPTKPFEGIMLRGGWGDLDDIPEPGEVLLPGYFLPMPHNAENQWISNMGIVDGQFHIQLTRSVNEYGGGFGAIGAIMYLICPDGEIIFPTQTVGFWADEDLAPVDISQYIVTYGQSPPHIIDEYIFDINPDELAQYTLAFTTSVIRGVEGNWKVKAYIEDTANQIITITSDIWIDGNHFEFIKITPLGILVKGRFTDDSPIDLDVIYVETASGLIPINGGWGSFGTGTFDLNWRAESPLDLSEITAIVIKGHHIPVP